MTEKELRHLSRKELLELLVAGSGSPPDRAGLEAELRRENHKKQYGRVLRSTLYVLIVVSACAVLAVMLWIPVLRIYGFSMEPTLCQGQVVVALKPAKIRQGDVLGCYYGNKLLVKRCIATSGQWVNMDEAGNVYVDEVLLEEPYLGEKALGQCDIKFPYQVPENALFVLGDNRETSVDSRSSAVGCITLDSVAGRILLRVWPLKDFGVVR